MTRSGWLLLAASLGSVVLGRVLGLQELTLIGATGLMLIVICVVAVRRARPHLQVIRQVHPPRVHVGDRARVELVVTNAGRRRSSVVCLADPITGTAGAEILLAPLAGGESVRATYQLPNPARGVVDIGPLDIVVGDPFGLTRRSVFGAAHTRLVVLPRVTPLVGLPDGGDNALDGVRRANVAGRAGEEFHSLRPYDRGDDLRRVHWPSTARTDELMVRKDELPGQGRTTVLVDRALPAGAAFEEVLSAAASLLEAAGARRDLVRLVFTDGTDSGFGSSRRHLDLLMEELALAVPEQDDTDRPASPSASDTRVPSAAVSTAVTTPASALTSALQQSAGGSLIALLGAGHPAGREVGQTAGSRFHIATIVQFETPDSDAGPGVPTAGGPETLIVPAGGRFADCWNQARVRREARR